MISKGTSSIKKRMKYMHLPFDLTRSMVRELKTSSVASPPADVVESSDRSRILRPSSS